MTGLALYARIAGFKRPVVTTTEVSAICQLLMPAASRALKRMEVARLVTRIARNLWMVGRQDPMKVASYMVEPHVGYVSLHTALRLHGMISQIPTDIYVVSTSRARRISTPIGTFSIHRMAPRMVDGYAFLPFPLATPEKALVDYLYLSPARSGLFSALPDLEIPPTFDIARAEGWVDRIPSPRRRALVRARLRKALATAERVEWRSTVSA